jgi:hypothetical protein
MAGEGSVTMRAALSCLALLALSAAVAAAAQPSATVAVCTAIVDNSCEGAALKFPSNVGRLYGFSQVIDAAKIVHVWLYKNKELGRIEMKAPPAAANWRTWSNVTVSKDMTGPWQLEVFGPDGKVLATFEFEVQ